MKRTRITVNYPKLLRSIVILFIFVTVLTGFLTGGIGNAMVKEQRYEIVRVYPGDTLWDIAKEYSDGDIRKTINEIKKFNNMKSTALVAYESIKVPID